MSVWVKEVWMSQNLQEDVGSQNWGTNKINKNRQNQTYLEKATVDLRVQSIELRRAKTICSPYAKAGQIYRDSGS